MSSDSESSISSFDSEDDCYCRCEYGNFRDCIDYGKYTDERWLESINKFKKLWYATKMRKIYILVRIEPFGSLIHYKQELKTDDGDVITQNNKDNTFRCILDSAFLDTSDDGPVQYFHTFIQEHFIIHNKKLYKYDFRRMLKVEGDPWGFGEAYAFDSYTPIRYIMPDVDSLAGFTHINNDMKYFPSDDEIYTGKIIL